MPVQVQKQDIPSGDAGTRITVARMAALIRAGAWQPLVRQRALAIVAGVNGRDGHAQALALRQWLVAHFHFVRDPTDTELLHTPVYLLTHADANGRVTADCDDAAVLGGALAQAVGLQARLVVVGFLARDAPFRHVWAEVAAPSGPERGTWVELDVTRSAQRLPFEWLSRIWIVPVVAPATTPTLWWGLLACTAIWALIFSKHSKKRPQLG